MFLLRVFPSLLISFALSGTTLAFAQSATPAAAFDPALVPARTAFDQGRWAEAEQLARLYVDAHPQSGEALYLLASAEFRENKPKDSLATFTRAAQIAQPSALAFRYVALDYVLLNDYTDADTWITRSAQENPKDGETWYVMGRVKYTENRFTEAVESFGHALELMPRSVKVEDNLGLAYEGLNRPDDAIKAYRQALEWQQGSSHPSEQPLLNLGILLTDRNQLGEALPLLKQAEALAPADGKIHGALGKLYARNNDLVLAQEELEQAVAATPKDSGLHFQLGQVYRKQGMTQKAAEELSRAAALEREGRH